MPFRDFAVHHDHRNKKLFRNGIPVQKIVHEWYSCTEKIVQESYSYTEKKLFRNEI